MNKITDIILGAGHGGVLPNGVKLCFKKDPDGRYLEGTGNRDFVQTLKYVIKTESDYRVTDLVGTSQLDIPLKTRIGAVNKYDKDTSIYISIHSNAKGMGKRWYNKKSEGGHVVFYYLWSKKGKKLAQLISEELGRNTTIRSRGIKSTLWLYVIRKSVPVAVLVERWFHTNKTDLLWGNSAEGRLDQSEAISRAIKRYDAWQMAESIINGGKK